MSRDRNAVHSTQIVKFLYSYGGRILPRRSDGTLRYIGGFTRVLSIDRSTSFSELMVKFEELCGSSNMYLRCKLPTEDLDVLLSITCDEDLANVIEEYDRFSALTKKEMKIRALLSFAGKGVYSIFANVLLRFSGVEFEAWKSRPVQFGSVVCGGA